MTSSTKAMLKCYSQDFLRVTVLFHLWVICYLLGCGSKYINRYKLNADRLKTSFKEEKKGKKG